MEASPKEKIDREKFSKNQRPSENAQREEKFESESLRLEKMRRLEMFGFWLHILMQDNTTC